MLVRMTKKRHILGKHTTERYVFDEIFFDNYAYANFCTHRYVLLIPS